MNLVGHVAAAVRHSPRASAGYLAGSMLPDLASMARVRLGGADGALGAGVAFHHAADGAFHACAWFNDRCRALRDELLASGVDRGAARACAHAGLEMLLDGAWTGERRVRGACERAFAVLTTDNTTRATVIDLVAEVDRDRWSQRLQRIGTSIDVDAYRAPVAIAHRLHRMTNDRRRIALRADQVDTVADVLRRSQRAVLTDADDVLAEVVAAV